MTANVKTALIAGVAVVGAFMLMSVLAPKPAHAKGAPSSTSSLSGIVGNIASIGGAVAGLFGNSSSPNDGTYHTDTSGFSISGNTLVDDGGNAVVYGTGY